MSSAFSIGLSGLTTSQRTLEVIGQNLANANRPDYHRQDVRLAARLPQELAKLQLGTGVEISRIRRLRSNLVESLVTRQTFELGDTTAQIETLRQIEVLIAPGEGTLHDRLETLFNALDELSTRPDDITQRRLVLSEAAALTDSIQSLAGELDRMRERIDADLRLSVDQINQEAVKIAALNGSIRRAEILGIEANDQRDNRDQRINELAALVGLRVLEKDNGQSSLFVSGFALVLADRAQSLQVTIDQQAGAVVTVEGSALPIPVVGGQLGGLLAVRNQLLPDLRSRLDTLAQELIRRLDEVQATGIPLTGPKTFLAGHRAVSDTTIPLSQASPAFAIQAGSLFVTMTNLGTGQQTLHEVVVDPALDSLQGLAIKLSAIPNLQAVVDAQTKTLGVLAQPGFGFDFAGRLQPVPATVGITGTTVPAITGVYTGSDNDRFDFRVVGSGTVGVTAGLTLEVRDLAGSLVASLNIGQGYEPGAALQVADGVKVSLTSGTANNADAFSATLVNDPDTAEVLAALGMSTFFLGDDAGSIRVNPDLVARPELLAASRTRQAGDNANLQRMSALRDQKLLAGQTQTFREFYAAVIGDVATKVQELTTLKEHQGLVAERLESERQSISGVDTNEELVRLLQYQRAYQMAAQYLSTVNETLDALFLIL